MFQLPVSRRLANRAEREYWLLGLNIEMYSALQQSTVQYSEVQYSTVKYSTVIVQYSIVQYTDVQEVFKSKKLELF